jgi:hypothetical protein
MAEQFFAAVIRFALLFGDVFTTGKSVVSSIGTLPVARLT